VTESEILQGSKEGPVARTIEKMVHSQARAQENSVALAPVLERLALGLWRSLRHLAGTDGRVALQTMSARRFQEYRGEIEAGSLMVLFDIGNAADPGLLVLDARLADAAIELLLGGGPSAGAETTTARAYTPADQAVARGLGRLIIAEFARALAAPAATTAALTGHPLRIETDPQLVTMGSADSSVAVARFEAALGPGGCGGTFDLVLPQTFLASLEQTSPRPRSTEPRQSLLPREHMGPISEVSFALHAVVDRLRVQLLDLSRWEAGTWVPLATGAEQPVTLYCERDDKGGLGPALFAGRLGSSRRRRAISITDVIDTPPQADDPQGSASK
jgi:flagellar motor switch protein FliM